MLITGRCLCGAIHWESAQPPIVTRVCWCRDCQYLGAGSGTVNACLRSEYFTVTGKTSDYRSVADSGNHTIRKLTPSGTNWIVTTIAGYPGLWGTADGSSNVARFFNPRGSVHSVVGGEGGGTAFSTWIVDKGKPLAEPVNHE